MLANAKPLTMLSVFRCLTTVNDVRYICRNNDVDVLQKQYRLRKFQNFRVLITT